MKRYTILLLIFAWYASASAQAPGYMGKRGTVSVQNAVFPALVGPVKPGNDNIINFNYRYGLALDYVTGRRTSFIFGIDFYKTYEQFTQRIQLQQQNYYNYTSYFPEDAFGEIKGRDFTLAYKGFFNDYLAPYGKFIRIGLCIANYTVKYDPLDFVYSDGSNTYVPQLGTGEDTFSNVIFKLGLGKQRVYWDKLVVNTEFELGFGPGSITSISEDFDSNRIADYIRNEANARVMRHHAFNVNLGFGFLAF